MVGGSALANRKINLYNSDLKICITDLSTLILQNNEI